ncbi:MAG: T9SS type A sorting domain-containing protein [Sphingobacteriaceae bacterium]|nr:T9SS type A sorting domain-containing protein [Sphingobacteriaceae bacterium]
MKKILQILIFSSVTFSLTSQTATSIANGNWTNPLTWNCTCVPINGYSVTINNSVTLNTSMVFNTGGITVNNTGSLIQDASLNRDIWINGGYFNNNGKSNLRYLLISAGSITNPGSFTVSAFTNSVSFNNTGSIQMDSMYVAGTFTNSATARITGDSITNTSSFVNSGRINVTWSTNTGILTNNNFYGGYAHTNAGVFFNNDSLILTGSLWNKANFYNNTPGKVRLTKNFHNYSIPKTAVYTNNGRVDVLDSWYNTDTVKGNSAGYFQVQDTTANSGYMKGFFTICDLTPTAPKIDLNSGFIDVPIMGCSLGMNENELTEIRLYPNPSNGVLHVKNENNANLKFSITDVTGKIILEQKLSNGISNFHLDYTNGIYFLKITDLQSGNSKAEKLIIQK